MYLVIVIRIVMQLFKDFIRVVSFWIKCLECAIVYDLTSRCTINQLLIYTVDPGLDLGFAQKQFSILVF